MKNKGTCPTHDTSVVGSKYHDNKIKTAIDLRIKSIPSEFLKKSASLLKNFAIDSKDNCGHPDVYFKRTLRNYDYFGIDKQLKSLKLNFNQSTDSIKEFHHLYKSKSQSDQKPKRKLKKYKPKKDKTSNNTETRAKKDLINSVKSDHYINDNNRVVQEEERFYSPVGHRSPQEPKARYLRELHPPKVKAHYSQQESDDTFYDTTTDDPLAHDNTRNANRMAEEEEGEDVFDDTEELLEQVEEEIQEIMDDNEELDMAFAEETEDEPEEQPPGEPEAETDVETEAETGVEPEAEADVEPEAETPVEPEAETPVEPEAPSVDEPAKPEVANEEPTGDGLPIGEIPSTIPESDIMKEVEDCEKQCMEIYAILNELKKRVAELLSKSTRTEQEDKELQDKQRQLNEKMLLLEQKTRRIELLLGKTKKGSKASKYRKYDEDILPKVLICGVAENNMPKIIVCDDKKLSGTGTRRSSSIKRERRMPPCMMPPQDLSVMPQFAKRLSESYCMQDKLATENANLEGMRYKLQEDLLNKDETVQSLQRKLTSLTAEMRVVLKENNLLTDKLCQLQNCPIPCSKAKGDTDFNKPKQVTPKMATCGKGRGTCPADVETRLQEYSETTQALEKQLNDMENEVKNMQNELLAVQKERMHLEQHRKMLAQCPPVCPQQPVCGQPPVCPAPPICPAPSCPAPCNPNRGAVIEIQLRELREQYNRLQDDYKGKLTEVAGLRTDSEKFKTILKEFDEYKRSAEEKIKALERELKEIRSVSKKNLGSKEQLVEQEQQLAVAKQRYREAKDELEEVRSLVEDQQNQLDDYRNKYLQAQQQVEEQRRQIDMMELEGNRVNEQVNLEIQRVKNQFQEKLQELTPLPDILKTTQLKLQESQQMHLLAERNNEALVRELQAYRDKAAAMANQMEKVRSDQQLGVDEMQTLQSKLEDAEARLNELLAENENLRGEVLRLEDVAEDAEKMAQEKLHEIAQLEAEIENVREESARQVSRTKDRCETVRRSMQNQISDLERQLAQSRAQSRQAQRDRDEIRQKMQAQINNLSENFEDAQMRIRNLQGHINFLKNSYSNVFPSGEPTQIVMDNIDPCNCGNF